VAKLRIEGVWGSKNNNDIALIRCDRRTIGDVPLARSLATPKVAPAVVGEVTIGLGFTGHMHPGPDTFKRVFRISHGVVRELHHEGAGTNPLVNVPMFQTSGQYDPGMSGGPVLDQNGKCIGVSPTA
jgi:S1-C subfamily serine protease